MGEEGASRQAEMVEEGASQQAEMVNNTMASHRDKHTHLGKPRWKSIMNSGDVRTLA